MSARWYSGALRWTEFGFWLSTSIFRWPEFLPSSIFRWPEFDFSYLSLRWLEISIDEVLWTFVTVLESVALVAMLCYFFVFCGCTL
ncbi:hypothetical protein K2173_022493 [Erythroxylum novogranatense]|uniref:Transmembrane protein n=1 Tax=Erythroxylum novogranatense TaxID=1862640 RepID=A0AAV8TJV4_9ROSI|nr:hypothetical protein K2173_022493 [Erythroxylum novogranatense]